MSHKLTAEGFVKTLTGFDEIAIEKAFDADIYQIADKKPVLSLRMLVFVDQTRSGATPAEAKDAALSMTTGGLEGYFAEDDEITPDEPTTAPGKDSASFD